MLSLRLRKSRLDTKHCNFGVCFLDFKFPHGKTSYSGIPTLKFYDLGNSDIGSSVLKMSTNDFGRFRPFRTSEIGVRNVVNSSTGSAAYRMKLAHAELLLGRVLLDAPTLLSHEKTRTNPSPSAAPTAPQYAIFSVSVALVFLFLNTKRRGA